jgi:hypothetical protein
MLGGKLSNNNSITISKQNNAENPQFYWINVFLKKSINGVNNGFSSLSELKESLLNDLSKAMEIFSIDSYRTDYYFLLIWLAYIKLQ